MGRVNDMSNPSDKKRNDIFNPEYRKNKPFIRKENIYRLIVIISILAVFIWGSRDFIYGYVTDIEIRNINYAIINKPVLHKDGDTGYFILNRATYDIKLIISCSAKDFKMSYNNTILIPNQILYINFYGTTYQDMEIIIKGVKI